MFQFYLNNILLEDEPLGWKEFPEVLERDRVLNGFFIKYPGELTFSGDGYTILKTILDATGYCQLVPFKVLEQCGDNIDYEIVFRGNIILSDIKLNLSKCLASTSVVDDSYSAKIYNNKSIKVNLSTNKSKVGNSITPAAIRLVDFFNPVDGIYTGDERKVIDVYEAFKLLVAFMTDGEVAFESDYLQSFEDTKNICLLSGLELRTFSNTTFPEVSFQELFDNINKKFPIGFVIEDDGEGNYTLRIEEESYFYSEQGNYQFSYVSDLEQSVDRSLLYSGVKVGSSKLSSYDSCIHSMFDLDTLSFKPVEFYFDNTCNIDSVLDLVSTYVIDTNTIEELVRSTISGELDCAGADYPVNTSYDNDVFIIQYSKIDNEATKCNILGNAPPWQYNGELNNISVVSRRNLLGNLYKFFNQTGIDGSFSSEIDTGANDSISYDGFIDTEIDFNTDLGGIWQNEVSDPTGSYNPVTSTYTAPTDGYYKFNPHIEFIDTDYFEEEDSNIRWLDIEISAGYIYDGDTFYLSGTRSDVYSGCQILFEQLNELLIKGNNGISRFIQDSYTGSLGKDLAFILNPVNIFMQASQTIQFFLKITPRAGVITYAGSTPTISPFSTGDPVVNFLVRGNLRNLNPAASQYGECGKPILQDKLETQFTPEGGGLIVEDTGDDYYSSLLNFTYPINNSDWQTMKTQLLNSFNANIDGVSNKVGWINRIERVIETGMAEVELTSNLNNI